MSAEPISVRVRRNFLQSPERVFDAFLDTDKARRFLFSTPTGEMVRAESVPLVGGVFIFTDRRDGVNIDHCGQYLAVERPHRLVFDFGIPAHSPQRDLVQIEIEREGEGASLTLTHQMAAEFAPYADSARHGWATILEGLARALE
jgi:uncharacterized protein YndB with AHSA1/START domain